MEPTNKPKKPSPTTSKTQKITWENTLDFLKGAAHKKNENAPDPLTPHYHNVLQELDRLNQEIAQLKDENLNHIARLQTMARRHSLDNQQAVKYGSQELARAILKPVDLFKKILSSPTQSEEIKNYLLGFEMISKQLDQALNDNGIKQIVVNVGDEFNPHFHEATELIETKAVPKGKIAAVSANGYQLHDRVLTHALVKVAK